MYEIEIKEGHDCSSYFWIRPVRVEPKDKITWDDVEEMEEEISIEESDVECFLAYFFYKHFDKELLYNKNRWEWSEDEFITHFEWWLTDNFYTYERMRNMLEDITQTALMLKYDYDNPSLQEVKKNFRFIICVNATVKTIGTIRHHWSAKPRSCGRISGWSSIFIFVLSEECIR